ncbi:MAG: DedA family protein [Verrucomicrobia bacterium]|nr:MAG: DedA family protein [Verrucomicrobiota bacterium]
MMQALIETWFHWVHEWGYGGVVLLMAMESSIFPVPSELVIPPAAILAAHGSGSMTLAGVIVAGTLGSWLGAAITYWAALLVGRPVVLRFGKYCFMPAAKVLRAERFMHRYEGGGIFFARLLPVIRHLISIPAGLIGMGFAKFSLLTLVGSAIWCAVLAALGQKVGNQLDAQQMDALRKGEGVDLTHLIHSVKHEASWIILAVAGVCFLYFVAMRLTKAGKS